MAEGNRRRRRGIGAEKSHTLTRQTRDAQFCAAGKDSAERAPCPQMHSARPPEDLPEDERTRDMAETRPSSTEFRASPPRPFSEEHCAGDHR